MHSARRNCTNDRLKHRGAHRQAYKVHIGHGLLDEVGVMLSVLHRPCQAMVVSDTNVAPLYLARLRTSLEAAGFRVLESVVPAGEASKSFAVWNV